MMGELSVRRVRRLLAILAVLICVFVVSLTVVYMLPQDTIRRRIASTVQIQSSEGMYPAAPMPYEGFMLDGFTDAICLDHAIREVGDSPLKAALAAANNDPDAFNGSTIDALGEATDGHRRALMHYSAYWHGYLIALRPALLFFDYYQLRYLNFLLLTVLGVLAMLSLHRVLGGAAAAAFALSFAAVGYWTSPASLQLSTMMYIGIAATIAACELWRRGLLELWGLEAFLVFGALTAFFDFLTVPLISFGLPVAVVLIARSQSKTPQSWVTQLKGVVSFGAAWVLGYAGSWVGKVVVGELFLHEGLPQVFTQKLLSRMGLREETIALGPMLWSNIKHLFPLVWMGGEEVNGRVPPNITAIVLAAAVVAGLAVLVVASRRRREDVAATASVLLVVPLPYLWYLVSANHSFHHPWFTYRTQVIAVFGLLYFAFSNIDLESLSRFRVIRSIVGVTPAPARQRGARDTKRAHS